MTLSQDVVNKDLAYICKSLSQELTCMSGKKLLITGGAGFLGYYLIQAILHWNKEADDALHVHLTVYDNIIRGNPPWLSNLECEENLVIVKHDVTDPLPEDIEDFQFIIHAASVASPTFYRKHPIETMDANIKGLRSLLEYCRKQKEKAKAVEGFLFFSSSEIYGNPSLENIPTPETYYGYVSCTGPRACYDESKRYGETLSVNFARQYDLPVKIVRPFNNYGPGLKITDRRVLPDFARNIMAGKDIVMLSDGTPTRTFCYVADAIIGYFKVLVNGQAGQAYNIGVEEPEISMSDLAHRVVSHARKLFSYEGKVVHKTSSEADYLADNPSRRCPDIAKARSHLGYNPNYQLSLRHFNKAEIK